MAYIIKDRVGRRKTLISYDASPAIFPIAGKRLARSRAVRSMMRQQKARHALVIRRGDSRSGIEAWWFGRKAGVSFGAAILNWILDQNDRAAAEDNDVAALPQDFHVVIPLDQRVYIARITDHTIAGEWMLPWENPDGESAEALVDQAVRERGIVFAWRVGKGKPAVLESAVADLVALDEVPFSLTEFRLRPAWQAFAGARLVHPMHIAGAAFLAGSLATSLGGFSPDDLLSYGPVRQVLEWAGLMEAEKSQQVNWTIITPPVPHNAHQHMRHLAMRLVEAETLHSDGLRSLRYDGGVLILEGKRESGYPRMARRFSEARSGEWDHSSNGWSISIGKGLEPADDHRPPALDSDQVIHAMLTLPARFTYDDGPSLVSSVRNTLLYTATVPMELTLFSVQLEESAIGNLVELSANMNGLPGTVKRADCSFDDYRLNNCTIYVEVTSL